MQCFCNLFFINFLGLTFSETIASCYMVRVPEQFKAKELKGLNESCTAPTP